MVSYRFEFRPYRRRFLRSLTTSHGSWNIRDGIILRLTSSSGCVGWGEIAPVSWFGSETIEQALSLCQQLPKEITEEIIFNLPPELPACQFGFETALEMVSGEWGVGSGTVGQGGSGKKISEIEIAISPYPPTPHSPLPTPLPNSALLSAGEGALQQWEKLWDSGYRTFKWKIGVLTISEELEIFDLLTQALPADAKLRLDANGGLSYDRANLWLWTCDNLAANDELPVEIEFIEQPLPPEDLQGMLELGDCYGTKIALDESVATLNQLISCYQQGWRDIFVIKPSIAGSPSRLREFCLTSKIDAVFSSVFETAIGRNAALRLAAELSQQNRAVGFGVNHWFAEESENWLQNLWKQ